MNSLDVDLFSSFQRMDCQKIYNYKVLQMPSKLGADMLYVNGRLIHRTHDELTQDSYTVSTSG